jgi:cytochrome c peroxidase
MKNLKRASLMLAWTVIVSAGCTEKKTESPATEDEDLGQRIFNDQNLSANRDLSCATCHSRAVGGTGPNSDLNLHGAVYQGSVSGRFGNRKPPSSSYATLSPCFDYSADLGVFFGGNFWDGRATGWNLGSPAAEQAQGPFLNPVEQAVPDSTELVSRVCGSDYGDLFRQVHGASACQNAEQGYAALALSIAAFEGSKEMNPFSSKYDLSLAGKATLEPLEQQGLALFNDRGKCAGCHVDDAAAASAFTDFTFDNLGIPPNPENPFYGMDKILVDGQAVNPLGSNWVDPGLGGFLATLVQDSAWRALPHVTAALHDMPDATITSLVQDNQGKHRVPTLRNVDLRPTADFVKAYGHNGFFKSLKGIVHFYNTRDTLPPCADSVTETEALASGCWPAPEVAETVNHTELGNLQLTSDEEDAIVAFLGTLSDGWVAQ